MWCMDKTSMAFEGIKELSVKIIREEFVSAAIPIQQILLFGSHSRGDARPDSDWDFLVCTEKELPFPQKAKISAKIQTRLAEKHVSADVIIKSETTLMKERDNVGVITYYALKDGIPV